MRGSGQEPFCEEAQSANRFLTPLSPSKLPKSSREGTARNINTVTKLLEMSRDHE
jgi:uncharacterized protein (DUF1697 family)